MSDESHHASQSDDRDLSRASERVDKAQSGRDEGRSGRRVSRRLRLWLVGAASVVVVLLVVMLLLPTLLSTGPGKRVLLSYVNSSIAGSVEAERLKLAWFGGQSVDGVTLNDPGGQLVASIRRVDVPDVRLVSVLLGRSQYGDVVIDAASIHVRQEPGEPTNVQLALQSTRPESNEDEPTTLDGDMSLQLSFTADRVTYEAPEMEQVTLTEVDLGVDIDRLQRIATRLSSNLMHGDQPGRVDLNLNLNDAFDADGQPQLGAATVQAKGEFANFPITMADRLMGQEGRLATLLGDELNATFTATGPMRSLEAAVRAQSPHMVADVQLIGDEQVIRAGEGSRLQLQVTPEAFASWIGSPAPGEAPAAQLVQPTTLDVRFGELVLPRDVEAGVDMAAAAINLTATAGGIVLDVPETGRVSLGEPRLNVQSSQMGRQIVFDLQTQARVGDVSDAVSAELSVQHLLDDAQPMQARLETTALPVALADVLAGQDGRLALTLGDRLDAVVNLQRMPTGLFTFAGQVNAPNLMGPFEGSYDVDGAMALRTPEPMTVRMTPMAFERWTVGDEADGDDGESSQRFALEQAAELLLNIEQFEMAMLDDLQAPAEVDGSVGSPEGAAVDDDAGRRFDPERTRIMADVTSPLLRLRDVTTDERFNIEQARVSLRGQDLRQLLEVDIEAVIEQLREALTEPDSQPSDANMRQRIEQRLSSPPDTQRPRQMTQPSAQQSEQQTEQQPAQQQLPEIVGQVRSQTRVVGLLNASGRMQLGRARIQSHTTLNSVPSSVLDALGRQGGSLAAVLGSYTSAEAEVDYRGTEGGTIDVALQSDNASANLPAMITSQRVLQLRDDATATLNVTPEMGSEVLATINPFLNAVSAERPVRLTISQQGFAIPLDDFDASQLHANALVDLGTLRLQQGNMARALFQTLSAVGGRVDPGRTYDAMFTPATLRLDGETLHYDDLGMQFSGLALGFRGSVNYQTQRFNLVMALPAETLGRLARGLERAAGPGYQLEVPVTGTFDEPQLDTAAMTRELTQLALQAGLREAVGGRNDATGGLLDIIMGRPSQPQREPAQQDDESQEGESDEQAQPRERDPVRDVLDLFRQRNDSSNEREQQDSQ